MSVDFQGVTIGSSVASAAHEGTETITLGGGSIQPIASSAQLRSSTPFDRNMLSRFQPTGGSDPSSSNIRLAGLNLQKLTVDAWLYHDTTSNTTDIQNVKPWRTNVENQDEVPNHASCVFVNNDVLCGAADGDVPDDGLTDYFQVVTKSDMINRWIHIQQISEMGTPGTANGTTITKVYNESGLLEAVSRLGTRNFGTAGDTAHWGIFYIGNYVRSGDWTGEHRTYWESIYMDNAWSRIEIGNHATYASATHREIQTPTAWADGSVTFKVNRGSFGTSASVWIYVIDNTNTVIATQAATLGTTY